MLSRPYSGNCQVFLDKGRGSCALSFTVFQESGTPSYCYNGQNNLTFSLVYPFSSAGTRRKTRKKYVRWPDNARDVCCCGSVLLDMFSPRGNRRIGL